MQEDGQIREFLADIGIDYERWTDAAVPPDASAEQILSAYELSELKNRGGYVTADVGTVQY